MKTYIDYFKEICKIPHGSGNTEKISDYFESFAKAHSLEYIREDEYVEVTPKNMRMRKVILDHLERKRSNKD